MSKQHFGEAYGANPAENYERFFVPAIGAPLATDLIRRAAIQPGERVLDVACGTGIVARRAAQHVGATGTVAALDVNPGMLAVARSTTPPGMSIEWHEANAEALPLPDEAFDVVLCQMGLQFVPDKPTVLREMRRVAVAGGRVLLSMPGPAGAVFTILSDALERHIGPEAAGFVQLVFSLHEITEIQQLMNVADLRDVHIEASTGTLRLPAPKEFLWQYVQSTPLAGMVGAADEKARAALEREVVSEWREFEEDGALLCPLRFVVARARR